MAFLYLNDWSMKGTGTLTSQWPKVERWYELMTHLSDTYGIAKIGVPHDFKRENYVVTPFPIVTSLTILNCLLTKDNYCWL